MQVQDIMAKLRDPQLNEQEKLILRQQLNAAVAAASQANPQVQPAAAAQSKPPAQQAQPAQQRQPAPPQKQQKPAAPHGRTGDWDLFMTREHLDTAMPFLRVVGAAILIGISAQSTIQYLASDITPLTITSLGGQMVLNGIELRLIIGVLVALGIFILELVLSERHKIAYRLVVAVDAWYTYRQIGAWFTTMWRAWGPTDIRDGPYGWWAWALIQIPAFGVGVLIAYYGEVLLIGGRRRRA